MRFDECQRSVFSDLWHFWASTNQVHLPNSDSPMAAAKLATMACSAESDTDHDH